MARWEDALDAQLDLVAKHGSDARTRAYAQGWMESYLRGMKGALNWRPEDTPDRIAAIAFNADAIHVDSDMMTIWEGALDGFEPEPLVMEDLITPAGFLYFPRPFYQQDINGKRVSSRAILWHPIDHILMERDQLLAAEKAMGELPEPYSVRMGDMLIPTKRVNNQLVAPGIILFAFTHTNDVDDFSLPHSEMRMTGLMLDHVMPWPYGSKFDKSDPGELGVLSYQALWRLMQQTLAVRTLHRPDRPTRKRVARAGWPEREVTVIKLRRTDPEHEKSDEIKDVNWTHRWLVGGHWRMQPYPTLGISRQIWISPYVKGPVDLPLRPRKARVFELVR